MAAITQSGCVRFNITDEEGRYALNGLGPGKYVVWACAKDYALYDNSNVDVESWAERNLDIQLLPELERSPASLVDMAGLEAKPNQPSTGTVTPTSR